MLAPLVQAKQDRSVGIEDLPEVVVCRRHLLLAKQRLIPLEAAGNVGDADDGPSALHRDTDGRRLTHRLERNAHAGGVSSATALDRLAARAECLVLNG